MHDPAGSTISPDSETERLQLVRRLYALDTYNIIDADPDQAFDDIVLIAAQLCDAPIALCSLVERDRQWFAARIGQPAP